MTLLTKLNSLLATVGSFLKCPVLLVIRLFWGWQFMQTGWGKLHNLDRTTNFFSGLGIPFPHLNAVMASCTELVGGTLLALGLLTRFATVPLIFCMCIAYWTADNEAVRAIYSDPDKFTGATPFLFLYAAVIIFTFGPGKLALDTLLFREKKA